MGKFKVMCQHIYEDGEVCVEQIRSSLSHNKAAKICFEQGFSRWTAVKESGKIVRAISVRYIDKD